MIRISSIRQSKAGFKIALREKPYKPWKEVIADAIVQPGQEHLNLIEDIWTLFSSIRDAKDGHELSVKYNAEERKRIVDTEYTDELRYSLGRKLDLVLPFKMILN